jgi:T5SS/PEP-CTERM-associated repeat protein
MLANTIKIGDERLSTGTIELSGGSAIVQGLTVGVNGRAFLTMTDSTVDAGQLVIGEDTNGDGEVRVGRNSTLRVRNSSSTMFVGLGGHGKLILEDGGSVIRDNGGTTSVEIGGQVLVNNGHFHTGSTLHLEGPMTINFPRGSVSIGQNVRIPGYLNLARGGTLSGQGFITGRTKNTGGHFLPNNSPGTFTIDGDYEQIAGVLQIEFAGTAPGQFDVLAVTGDVTLGGKLWLEFIDGFVPQQGQVFQFLDIGGTLSGAFDSIRVVGLRPGFQFDLQPDAGGLKMVALNDGVLAPEPGTLAMLLAGILATLFRRGGAASPIRHGTMK